MWQLGLRDAACREAGFLTTFMLRMLAFNGFNRPVLKHGPRSLTCLRVFGWGKPLCTMKVKVEIPVMGSIDART